MFSAGYDSIGGGRRHEGGNGKGEKFNRERNDGFSGDPSAKSHYQAQDNDSGGERSQRSSRGKHLHHNGDDMNNQQYRDSNRNGQKQPPQQGKLNNIIYKCNYMYVGLMQLLYC